MSILYTVFVVEEDGIGHFNRMFKSETDFAEFISSYPFPIHSCEYQGEFDMNEKQDWVQVESEHLFLKVNKAVRDDCRKRLERFV